MAVCWIKCFNEEISVRIWLCFNHRDQSTERFSNHPLVELQQMTCNPVKGSQAGALEVLTHFSPLIESSTWNGLLQSALLFDPHSHLPTSVVFSHFAHGGLYSESTKQI